MLVCEGDARSADPTALLMFHQVRSASSDPMTARGTATLLGTLMRVDDAMLDRIVDRVLQTVAWPAPEARAQPTDRVALERLWAAIRAGRRRAHRPRGPGPRPHGARAAVARISHFGAGAPVLNTFCSASSALPK